MIKINISNSENKNTTFAIFKPRTKSELITETLNDFANKVPNTYTNLIYGIPNNSNLSTSDIFVSRSFTNNLGLSEWFTGRHFRFTEIIPSRSILINFNPAVTTTFKFVPSSVTTKLITQNSNYNYITHDIIMLKSRTIQAYLALQPLAQNQHLLTSLVRGSYVDEAAKLFKVIMQSVLRSEN